MLNKSPHLSDQIIVEILLGTFVACLVILIGCRVIIIASKVLI